MYSVRTYTTCTNIYTSTYIYSGVKTSPPSLSPTLSQLIKFQDSGAAASSWSEWKPEDEDPEIEKIKKEAFHDRAVLEDSNSKTHQSL